MRPEEGNYGEEEAMHLLLTTKRRTPDSSFAGGRMPADA
jgi:hypothetical protein